MQYNKDKVLFTYVCIFPVQCPICEGNSMFRFYYKKIINQIEFKKWNNLKKKKTGLRTLHNLTNITILNPTAALQKSVET